MALTFGSYDAKNKCRVFVFSVEMNGTNIRLRMTLKINVGYLSLASEMNGANIRLRMTLTNKCRVFVFSVENEWR